MESWYLQFKNTVHFNKITFIFCTWNGLNAATTYILYIHWVSCGYYHILHHSHFYRARRGRIAELVSVYILFTEQPMTLVGLERKRERRTETRSDKGNKEHMLRHHCKDNYTDCCLLTSVVHHKSVTECAHYSPSAPHIIGRSSVAPWFLYSSLVCYEYTVMFNC